MGLNIAPQFRVVANSQDITDKVRERLKHIRLVDETGATSDTLEIALADNVPTDPIKIPPRGAELEVFLGYDGDVRRMGLFVCGEIELSGFPREMVIRARAAPHEATPSGRVDLQSHKTRSWKAGTTLGDMVRRIAGEHRLKPAIAPQLAAIALPHTDQAHESDINLLQRLARRYDAIAKPAGGSLVFAPRGTATTASGAAMPRITLTPEDGSDYRVVFPSRESAGSCIAYYRDIAAAKRRFVTVGEGEPVHRLRHSFKDKDSAEAAARARLRARARGERTLSYTFPGRPDVVAESLAVMKGFREGVDGEWLVTRAEHYMGPNGYTCTIEGESPNSAQRVAKASNTQAADAVQPATAIDAGG